MFFSEERISKDTFHLDTQDFIRDNCGIKSGKPYASLACSCTVTIEEFIQERFLIVYYIFIISSFSGY